MESNMKWVNNHPITSVKWVEVSLVNANDYNPNKVAKSEMDLLRLSIEKDGFTQPIVAWGMDDGTYQVVDGFHRHLVGKEMGLTHLPLVVIRDSQKGKGDRIASTIRHNRARGKHQIGSMSEIVVDLVKRNWSDKKIGKNLGMDEDEVLRLKQVSGIASLFEDTEYTEAWEVKQ